jgi:hypothetical protein
VAHICGPLSLSLVSNLNMTFRKWAVRLVLFAGGLFLSLLLITFLIVQIQLIISRWRAERLSSDMHQIRLYQSTWADAQRLMHRWGAWGHYDGSCTDADCRYAIGMGTIRYQNPNAPRRAWVEWLSAHDRLNLYQWLGGRDVVFYASFTVHDGTIWRTGSGIGVDVPTRRMRRDNDWPWSLSISAESRQRLHRTIEDPFSYMYSEDQLAQHPYYKVGRPSGCKVNCQFEVVYYSTHTAPAEIERLTSYNFSCFTQFIACAHIDDLLPASKEWRLYDDPYQSSPTVPIPPPRPESSYVMPIPPPCSKIPVWAHARDVRYALAIEVLPTTADDQKYDPRKAKVRVVTSLKEPAPWLPGAIVSAYSYGSGYIPPEKGQDLVPGQRFIVFPVGNDEKHDILTKDPPIKLDRCGVLEDTPEIRRELEKGFAQNDTLNH